MSNITIELATIQHFEQVNALVKEGHDEHVEALPHIFKDVQEVMPMSYYQQLIDEPDSDIVIAQCSDEVVGFAVISLEQAPSFESVMPRKYAYIHDFGVKGNQQRKGIGNLLFMSCKKWAKTNDASSIELNVWAFNNKAIAFYEQVNMQCVSQKMELKL